MQVNFSKHALRRLEERDVTQEEALQVIQAPEKVAFKDDTKIAMRLRKNGRLLIVIYTTSDTIMNVITIIDTSKVKKYF